VELSACDGDPVESVAATQVVRGLCLALDELEDEDAPLGQVADDRSSDSGLGGRHRVLVLVLAVDGEEARVLGGDPDDVSAAVGLHLVVDVRQPAGELRDGMGAFELGDEPEDFVDRRTAAPHVA
jgi:hypothetical protein